MKKKIIVIGVLLLFVVTVIGVSYAAFSYSQTGAYENTITTGEISMSYDETSKVINMNGALPTTDETGKASLVEGEYFDFSVTTHIVGDTNINWEISAKALDSNTFDGSNVRLYLTKIVDGEEIPVSYPANYYEETTADNFTGRPAGEMSLLVGTTSQQGDVTTNYRLRMWVDEDYNPQGDTAGKTFAVEVNVYGKTSSSNEIFVATALLNDSQNGIDTSDSSQTFITGENPNNYIWYSGKLWRAVSIDPVDNTVKIITQWNIKNQGINGVLESLRNYEHYIKMDSTWYRSGLENNRPVNHYVTDSIGQLNQTEFEHSYLNATSSTGYLVNNLNWTLSIAAGPYPYYVHTDGTISYAPGNADYGGGRPAVNLKSTIKVVAGSGTEKDPYRLEGDNDQDVSGELLNTRYSGEYVRFGTGENNLYRIVSINNNKVKLTSAVPLKNSGSYLSMNYNETLSFIGENYLNTGNGYLTTVQLNMMDGSVSLLASGELMSGQFDISTNNVGYWTSSAGLSSGQIVVSATGSSGTYYGASISSSYGIKPAFYLKDTVKIVSGTGTKDQPFEITI